jgi:predicted HicB family RNase H-like nuclease
MSGSTSRDKETRESRSIKIKPSILLKAHIEAVKEGKSLGWWVEEAIKEKIEREETEPK